MSINKENILAVADYLENKVTDKHFNMKNWYMDHRSGRVLSVYDFGRGDPRSKAGGLVADCGTAACVAGFVVGVLDPKSEQGVPKWRAAKLLFGDEYHRFATPLFQPAGFEGKGAAKFTRKRAVRTLRHIAEVGEDWNGKWRR